MLNKFFNVLILLGVVFCGTVHAEEPSPLSKADLDNLIVARACMVYDVSSGQMIYGKNIDTPHPPASVVKLMTALLAYENLKPDQFCTVARQDTRVEPSSIPLRTGERVQVRNMINAILIASDNDAAMLLARESAGSVSAFVDKMNQRAKSLGCTKTNFENPHGLPIKGQYTTARDLMKIFQRVLEIPELRRIMQTEYYPIRTQIGFQRLKNHNKLLGNLYDMGLEGMGPAKTGWTRSSRHTYAASVTRDGREILITILNSTNKWADTKLLTRYAYHHLPPVRTSSRIVRAEVVDEENELISDESSAVLNKRSNAELFPNMRR